MCHLVEPGCWLISCSVCSALGYVLRLCHPCSVYNFVIGEYILVCVLFGQVRQIYMCVLRMCVRPRDCSGAASSMATKSLIALASNMATRLPHLNGVLMGEAAGFCCCDLQ